MRRFLQRERAVYLTREGGYIAVRGKRKAAEFQAIVDETREAAGLPIIRSYLVEGLNPIRAKNFGEAKIS